MTRQEFMADMYQLIGTLADTNDLFDDVWVDRLLTITYMLTHSDDDTNVVVDTYLDAIAEFTDGLTARWKEQDGYA